jgi:tRNA-dihydrouridine synthase
MRHLADSAAYRGERRGVLSFRRHYAGYLRGEHSIAHLRKDLMQIETVAGVHERLLRYLDERQAPVAV